MHKKLTRGFLRARFWGATLVLLVSLAGAAGVVIFALKTQEARGHYVLAFERLSDAVTHAELELTRLRIEGATQDRSSAQAAYIDLLTLFSAIRASDLDGERMLDSSATRTNDEIQLVRLLEEFQIDPFEEARNRQLQVGSMPEALDELWETRRDQAGDERAVAIADMPLETALCSFLLVAQPLILGDGPLDPAQLRAFGLLESLVAERIHPLLLDVSIALEQELDRMVQSSIISVLGCLALGGMATLFNFVTIFRPLTNAVMANQDELISERDKAVAADIAKRNFLSVVSHELRTPMNGVLGFASLLAASDLKPEHRKQVEIIQSSGKALLALVNDILDFSKLEAGSLELADENFSIEEVISGVVTLLRCGVVEKRLEMSFFFDPRLPKSLRGDRNRLRQILTNLVGNAIKFTESGSISVEAREVSSTSAAQDRRELQLSVTDTGIGIPADERDAIFERFTQIDSSPRRKFEGTGLGLAICRQLTEKMGGRIWVESTLGVGSTFYVRIPLTAAISPADCRLVALGVTGDVAAEASVGTDEPRILLVEDNKVGQALVLEMLSHSHFQVDAVADGVEAAQAVSRRPYDLILMDIRMPNMGGLDAMRRIRAVGGAAGRVPIIALTANALNDDVAEYYAAGMQNVVKKPVDRDILLAAIDAALDFAEGPDKGMDVVSVSQAAAAE